MRVRIVPELSAPFLAAATVIVYAGAIIVTFMFVIMLAQQGGATAYDQRSRQPLAGSLVSFFVLGALVFSLLDWQRVTRPAGLAAEGPALIAAGGDSGPGQLGATAADSARLPELGRHAVRRLFVRGRARRHAAAGRHDRRHCAGAASAAREPMNGDFNAYLAVGAVLFVLGAIGFVTRRNLILMMLSAELMLHGVSLTLVAFGRMHGRMEGQAFTVFMLTVAACEAGLSLSIILSLYQRCSRWTSSCGAS